MITADAREALREGEAPSEPSSARRMRLGSSLALAFFLLLICSGCGAFQKPALTLNSIDTETRLDQTFTEAWFIEAGDGRYEIVLVKNDAPTTSRKAPKPGQPLEMTTRQPLRQVVHLRVFWRPTRGTKADHPAATNTAVDWYLFGHVNQDHADDMIQYDGAGFVSVYAGKDNATFVVRTATMQPRSRRGDLSDPLGRSTLRGTIKAQRSPERVATILENLRAAASAPGTTQAIAPSQPPPRPPSGP
ncbi:MAG: hypothetical protein ACREIT_00885 [Tepidisphaeraceae bacterium]